MSKWTMVINTVSDNLEELNGIYLREKTYVIPQDNIVAIMKVEDSSDAKD